MNIESIVRQLNNSYNQQNVQGQNPVISTQQMSLQKGLEHILNASNGQVLSGQVVSVDGENIVLSLSEGELINARLEGSLKPGIGQILSFEIKGNQSGTISLSPLFTNTAEATTVNNALTAAGLPITSQNQYMVKSMMEEGLSVDKTSLYNMSQAAAANSTADVLDLAKMTRLNIPLTPEMVEEFKAYQNFEHEITVALSDIGESFAESVTEAIDVMPFDKVLEFIDVSTNALLDFEAEETLQNIDLEHNTDLEQKELTPEKTAETLNEVSGKDSVEVPSKTPIEVKVNDSVLNLPEEELFSSEDSNETVPRNVARSVIRDARALGIPEEIVDQAKSGTLTPKNLVKSVFDSIKALNPNELTAGEKELVSKNLSKLFENEDFKDLLKKEITGKFLLKPEEVAEDGKVSKLYERMTNEIHKLSQNISQLGVKDSPLQSSVNNLSANVDFMNELNHTFNYVQIPLKFNQSETAGELYVYSNKKSLSKDDGNVSALLHLDMENLGPVDVHVLMNESNNVKTKFFLKDDEALDLIADNIDILNKRLEKRGYSMTSEFVNKEKNTSVLDSILEETKNISLISTGSFDARA